MITRQFKRSLIGSILFTAVATAVGAGITTLPVKSVNGKKYHYYTGQPHETLYALSKQFGVSESEILKLNPSASEGLKAGQELILGVAKSSPVATSAATGTYEVKKQETAYGISKRFGLTLDEFYALNPEAKDGVKEGQVVIVKGPAAKQPTKQTETKAKKSGKTHVIAEHETLYQIARDNNIPLSDLLAANPGLDAARYSAGTEIVIPTAKETETKVAKTVVAVQSSESKGDYKVKAGDTFYGIATRHGISTEQLYAANPGIDILKEGMTIKLPDACDEKTEAPSGSETKLATVSGNPITIAVALPFQIDQKAKHNKNMVEFYRGFLMAVDSMRNMGQPIHILTYDTKGTDEGLQEILANPDLKKANAIVAPDNAEHLKALNQFGLDNRIAVMNIFNNRDSAFYTNPYAIQAALPRDDMYNRAAQAFIDNFDGFVPVILVSSDGRKEKTEFTDVVKAMLEKSGKNYKELPYSGTLTLEQLVNSLPATDKYAFLPASSHKDEFEKIATALQAYKDTRDFKNEVIVWGYPEWLANRTAYEKMHELDCYIYSRTDLPEPFMTESINEMYKKWFGPTMNMNYPRRSYMGFDTGMYLLRTVSATGGDFEKLLPYVQSITMPVTLKRYQGGGLYNDELLLINLSPGETISKRSI